MSAARWEFVRLGPEISDPANQAIVVKIKEALEQARV
jgi:hypothetical protein